MAFPIIKLNQVLTESKVEAPSSDSSKRIRVRLHAKGVEKRPEMNEKVGATKYYIRRAGQFVYGRQNLHKGAFGVIPPELDGFQSSSDIPSFDVTARCLPEWVDLFLKQGGYFLELSKLASGVGSQRISPSKFLSLEMPLPSIEQQRAILDQVEFYEVSQSQLLFELTHQQSLLKKLRQQILQEAIEGRLTADWRAKNPDVEPASELLKRIAAEKAQLVKDKKIKAQKPLPPISDEEKPFELPQGWRWCRLGDVANGFQYGTSSKSKKSGDVPVLRMGNIQSGEVDWNGLVYSSDAAEIEKYRLIVGDLLFNRTNSRELVGKTALYRGYQPAIYAGYLVRFHMAGSISPDYANIVMNSRLHSEWCDEVKTDALGQSNINATKLSGFRFPLAPIDEQEMIIDKADKLLALCDQLEVQITQNQNHAEQLMQAVLKEAFSHNNEAESAATKNKTRSDAGEVDRA